MNDFWISESAHREVVKRLEDKIGRVREDCRVREVQVADEQIRRSLPIVGVINHPDGGVTVLAELPATETTQTAQPHGEAAWKTMDTCPTGRRVLVCVGRDRHRMVVAYKTSDGLVLNEAMNPMPFPPTWWQELPPRPDTTGDAVKVPGDSSWCSWGELSPTQVSTDWRDNLIERPEPKQKTMVADWFVEPLGCTVRRVNGISTARAHGLNLHGVVLMIPDTEREVGA
jgi:hypothetical protein